MHIDIIHYVTGYVVYSIYDMQHLDKIILSCWQANNVHITGNYDIDSDQCPAHVQ